MNLILKGFCAEMEKIALTRYAIEDHSDETGDAAILHRSAMGSDGPEYIPPSKKEKKKGLRYASKKEDWGERVSTNYSDDDSDFDYQTARAMNPDPAIRFSK